MKPVPQTLLEDVFPEQYAKWLISANLEGRSTVDGFLKTLQLGYETRSLAAYVDDLDKPTSFLVVGTIHSVILDKPTCAIFYLDGEGDSADALETAEAFGKLHGCGDVAIASWIYLDSESGVPQEVLEEFDEQETILTKLL